MIGGFLLWLFETLGLSAVKRWWGNRSNPKQVSDNAVIQAKNAETEALAKPVGSWDDTVNKL